MNKFVKALVAFAALSAAVIPSQAIEPGNGVHFMLNAGITGGGDTLGTAQYTSGSTDSVKAGGTVQFGGGIYWQANTMPVALEATLNYHVDDSTATNGSMTFDRVPLEAIIYYTGVPRWRFGAGLRYVTSPQFKLHIDGGTDESIDFKDTTGALIQIGYGITQKAWVNLRFVSEKYQPTTYTYGGTAYDVSNSPSVDGSHIGVNFSYIF